MIEYKLRAQSSYRCVGKMYKLIVLNSCQSAFYDTNKTHPLSHKALIM